MSREVDWDRGPPARQESITRVPGTSPKSQFLAPNPARQQAEQVLPARNVIVDVVSLAQ